MTLPKNVLRNSLTGKFIILRLIHTVMYRSGMLLFIFLLANYAFAQVVPPSIQWQHQMGGSLDDIAYDITPTSDGGFITTGGSTSSDGDLLKLAEPEHGGNYDYWFAKIDAASNFQWKKHLGGTGSDLSRRVFQTVDGGYLLGGSSNSNDIDVTGNHGDYDFWVVKLFSSGSVQWSKSYGGTDYDDFGSMRLTSDGGYIFCGGVQSNNGDVSGNHGSSDFWLLKTDASGNIQWQKTYGGSGYEKAADVEQCPDGGYLLAGFTESNDGDVTGNHGDYDAWIVKTDANGVLQWQRSTGGDSDDDAQGVLVLADGSSIISGYTFSNNGDVSGNHGDYDAWLFKLDASGSLVWSKCHGGSSTDWASEAEVVSDTALIVACLSKSNDGDVGGNYGLWDFWVMKTDLEGTIEWQQHYGGSLNDVCYAAKPTYDGGFILGGYSESLDYDASGNHGKKDYWAVRLQGFVGVDEIENHEYALVVYPQPAEDYFHITISAPGIKSLENPVLQIMDMQGRLITPEFIISSSAFSNRLQQME
jgi:hypothetical protein